MNKQPFLILAISFILGIFFQDHFSLHDNLIYTIIGFCVIVLCSTFFSTFFFHKTRSYVLGLMFFGMGIVFHFFNSFSSQKVLVSKNENVIFKISKKLNSNEKNRKYEAVVQSGKERFNAIVYLPKTEKELDFDHYYQSVAYISKPRPPKYNFQFDYTKYLKRKNIEYQCYINSKILSVKRNGLSLNEKFSQERHIVLQNIDKTKMSTQSREFLKGIILADRTEMDAQTVQDFNRSGLVHFLAISGTHIVIIFGLLYFLLIKFLPLKLRKYAIISSLIFIWLFTVFIGFGSSVVRSSIMLSVYFVYVLLQRKPDLLHSLSLSALIILFFDTQQLFDVGFQLSFLAVLGIFWLNQPILNRFPKQNTWLKKILFNTISISVSAQLATLPLVLYYFHQFSFISVVANFFIVPFSEIIIGFSFLMTILIAFNCDFGLLNVVYDFIVQILLNVIHWFADFESLFFENIPMHILEVFLLLLVVYTLRFFILNFNYRNSARLIMIVFTFLIFRYSFSIYENQNKEILIHHFNKDVIFSVKKGDEACFWISEKSDIEKINTFLINPYIASRRLSEVKIRTFPNTTEVIVFDDEYFKIKQSISD